MAKIITPADPANRLEDGTEIVLLDTREITRFGEGHVLRTTNLPLSHLEFSVRDVEQRLTTPAAIIDKVRCAMSLFRPNITYARSKRRPRPPTPQSHRPSTPHRPAPLRCFDPGVRDACNTRLAFWKRKPEP